jgi:UTP--glucose-1-phosphate uridylyltransferase
VTRRLLDTYQSLDAACVIAVEEVPETDAPRYGIVKPKAGVGDVFEIDDLVEKPPAHELPSNLAIAGRYVLSPEMFDLILRVKPGAGGELQLTDAIRLAIAAGKRVWCVRLTKTEKRIDIGTFESYFEALMAACCSDEELGNKMRRIAAPADTE